MPDLTEDIRTLLSEHTLDDVLTAIAQRLDGHGDWIIRDQGDEAKANPYHADARAIRDARKGLHLSAVKVPLREPKTRGTPG